MNVGKAAVSSPSAADAAVAVVAAAELPCGCASAEVRQERFADCRSQMDAPALIEKVAPAMSMEAIAEETLNFVLLVDVAEPCVEPS